MSISARIGRLILSGSASCRMAASSKPAESRNSPIAWYYPAQAKTLVEQGGTLEVGEEVLACQIVNGQPAVARFSAKNYLKAKELAASTHVHLMDALSEVAYADPAMMRGLVRKELHGGTAVMRAVGER
jgi:hypothetical protein